MSTKEIWLQVLVQVTSTLIVAVILYFVQKELSPKN